ncbi:MAG: radical SAM protein [bacterium]|nr:radical SAM protein [bacterium]
MTKTRDCIVVGYNEVDYHQYAASVKPLAEHSAAYVDCKTNSILCNGKRRSYMQVFNQSIKMATGRDVKYSAFGTPNLAVFSLTHFLRKRGFSVEPVNLFQFDNDTLSELLDENPTAVAITTTFYVDPAPIKEIVQFIRARNSTTTIIVGGPYILKLISTVDPSILSYVVDALQADVCVVEPQGEYTLSRLLTALRQGKQTDISHISNLLYKNDRGRWVKTRPVPENNSLDENIIDWSQFKHRFDGNAALVRTARGCVYHCAFCAYPLLGGAFIGAEIATIERELRQLHDLGVRYLHFVDDTFNLPKDRFNALCRMMRDNHFQFQWTSFFRCGNTDDEQIALAAESGCIGVELGIESGDDSILKNMNKHANRAEYLKRIRQFERAGIMTYCMFIVGFPGETEDTVRQTLQLLDEAQPTFYIPGMYYHDSAAPIEQRRDEFGLQGAGYSWKHDTMSWQEAAQWVEYMCRNVTSSTVMPLQGFSFETVTYLLGQGFSIETIKTFTKIAQRMMVKSLDEHPGTLEAEWNELQLLFIE